MSGSTSTFARNVDCPVTQHAEGADADEVLDGLLETGLPVVLMGNTVADLMRDMQDGIEERAEGFEEAETEDNKEEEEVVSELAEMLSDPPSMEQLTQQEGGKVSDDEDGR